MSGVAGTLPPQSSGRRPGIEDALRLRRLQARRGAGQAGRQRGRPAPRLAADRGRAGRDSGDDRCQWHVPLPPRREQERHAGDRRERGAAGAVRLRTLRRAPGRLPRAHRLLLGALRRKHPAGVLQLPPPRARAGQIAGKGCD